MGRGHPESELCVIALYLVLQSFWWAAVRTGMNGCNLQLSSTSFCRINRGEIESGNYTLSAKACLHERSC